MKPVSARMALVAIILLFVLPLMLAWFLFSGTLGFRPTATTNAGELVQPLVPLPWNDITLSAGEPGTTKAMEGFWVIIFPLPDVCSSDCLAHAAELRQLHRSLGRNQQSVRILLLSASGSAPDTDGELLRIYSGFSLGARPSVEFSDALERVRSGAQDPEASPRFYLVDPLGNIMMTYSGDSAPEKMRKDLKMLLTWSNQDNRQ